MREAEGARLCRGCFSSEALLLAVVRHAVHLVRK